MIIKKMWMKRGKNVTYMKVGWFLLGIIPLYIADLEPRGLFK